MSPCSCHLNAVPGAYMNRTPGPNATPVHSLGQVGTETQQGDASFEHWASVTRFLFRHLDSLSGARR
jgi:hypothetical protein